MPPGDLFAPFPSCQFDVIIFNAPWVVARVRNRAELAIHDEKQETVKRFFAQVPDFLKPNGAILFGYADASGPRAIDNLEAIIAKLVLKWRLSLRDGLRRIAQNGSGSRFGCLYYIPVDKSPRKWYAKKNIYVKVCRNGLLAKQEALNKALNIYRTYMRAFIVFYLKKIPGERLKA